MICSENERSSLSTGPMIAPGFTIAIRSSAPASRANSQALRSAIAFERVYGVRLGVRAVGPVLLGVGGPFGAARPL